jgi:hypothetical protein
MTVNVQPVTVAASIAALSFGSISIADIDEIPESGTLETPIMFPQPDGFISDVGMSFETFGSNTGAKMNMTYTLNYVFLQNEIGGSVGSFDSYKNLITNFAAIMKVIFSNDAITGAVDIKLQSVPVLGVISSPSGIQYWGFLFGLRVLEYVQ